MKFTDSVEKEIQRYAGLLESRPPKEGHLAENFWDYRARRWHDDLKYKENEERSQKRVDGVIRYLSEQGALGTGKTVLDIGCGLGRFTEAMARCSGCVTGIDVSDTMLSYAKSYCEEMGTVNTKWLHMDFKEPFWNDLTEKYDLVFASQTPAVCDMVSLKKMIDLSRGWCFLSRYNYRENTLFDDIARNLFNTAILRDSDRRDGRRTYAIWNILWLLGYTPQIQYYRVEGISQYHAEPELAEEIAGRLTLSETDRADANERIFDYLRKHADQDGVILSETRDEFAWFLWDVRTWQSRECYEQMEIGI